MPFKGMLKWAVATDHPSSKPKSSTKSLKKRRKQSHHHHYCSIIKSGVCLRIENVGGKKAISTSQPPSTVPVKVDECKSVGHKLSKSGSHGDSVSGANNSNNCRVQVPLQRSSSSSRFRLKVARHPTTLTNMGNTNSLVKPTESKVEDCCPSGNTPNNIVSHAAIPANNTNNNTTNQNNNKTLKNNSGGDNTAAGTMNRNNVKNRILSSNVSGGASSQTSHGALDGNNTDSKSLLYMSLDHLPLAIVKQYERMLQETEQQQQQPVAEDDDRKFAKKKMTRPSQSVSTGALKDAKSGEKKSTSSMPGVSVEPPVPKSRSSIIKSQHSNGNNGSSRGRADSNQPKKITIISPPKSKHESLPTKHERTKLLPIINDREQCQSNRKEKSSKSFQNSNALVSIKEARSRPLQIHASNPEPQTPKSSKPKQASPPSSPAKGNNEKCTQTNSPKPKSRFKVTIVNSPVSTNTELITQKGNKINDVERKDASCSTELKHFPLKSILKDCKSSTLPRMRSQDSKPRKSSSSSSSNSSSSNSQRKSKSHKQTTYGRSSSFRNINKNNEFEREQETFLCSPLSSRKLYQSLHDIYTSRNQDCFKVPRAPSSTSSTTPSDLTTTTETKTGSGGLSQSRNTTILDHDVTDPQFLEEPMPISTPAISRCAKKLTLKRSEIRKLERIRNQTEKLNRFLKKYYHDCLPSLEEEEEQCIPEEKSVHLSVLRTHWVEKIPEESSTFPDGNRSGKYLQQEPKSKSQRRNTLPHPNISTAQVIQQARLLSRNGNSKSSANVHTAGESRNEIADGEEDPISSLNIINSEDNAIIEENNKNSSLLSSSAFYSDPILSSLPIIIEDPEILLHQQQIEYKMRSNKSNGAATRSSSCSSILINNNNKTACSLSSAPSASLTKSPVKNRRSSTSSISSCSCSCSSSGSSTSVSGNVNCCNSKCSSQASSIVNLANEFRMAEVIRHNNIHESFLMSAHIFPEDSSLLLEKDKEGSGSSAAIPTVNENEVNQNCDSDPPYCNMERWTRIKEGGNGIDSFAISSPAYENQLSMEKSVKGRSDSNNNNNEEKKRTTRRNNNGNKNGKVMGFASVKVSSTGSSSNSINSVDDEDSHGLIEDEQADHCFGPEKLKGYSTMMMMMGSGEDPLGNNNPFDVPTSLVEDEGFMSPYPPEAYSPASSNSSNNSSLLNRLSISSGKGSAEDYDDERRLELFFLDSSCETSLMIEQQQIACKENTNYTGKAELSHIIPGQESQKGEGGHECEEKGEKADSNHLYGDQDQENVNVDCNHVPGIRQEQEGMRIPFPALPPRPCSKVLNSNYLEGCGLPQDETWNSHDYATICPSNSSTTSGSSTFTYAACGSFFPNSNLLESHHERQISSSSSTAAYSALNECENDHHLHHYDHNLHHHYDEISKEAALAHNHFHADNNNDEYFDDDSQQDSEQEESLIIQSSAGNSTGAFGGIAFSTPIRPIKVLKKNCHLRPKAVQRLMRNSNYSQSSSIAGNSFLSKSSFTSSYVSAMSNRSISMRKKRYSTPRKVVKKPPVKTPFSGKGEVLIRCYRNGDYVTVHVVQVKNLQVSYRSSWKLSMKISLIPEGEATFTKSESVVVPSAKRFVRIDQKFSFEIPQKDKSVRHYLGNNCSGGTTTTGLQAQRKLFLTFVKRIEKRSTFLGWITLDVPETENTTQCWLKLRKRKMSSSYSAPAPTTHHLHNQAQSPPVPSPRQLLPGPSHSHQCPGGVASTSASEAMVGLPSTLDQGVAPSVPSRSSCKSPEFYPQPEYLGKTQLQNSSTMDSGVEDCCEPPPVPSIDLDEKLGFRVRVHMTKPEGAGFGFSVVWVSPPRIERLEKEKTADLAGLKIGDLIIGVNGEDVTTVANTAIYNKMKSTGKELDLEVWRKHAHVTSPIPPHITAVPQINPTSCLQLPGAPPPVMGTSLNVKSSKAGVTIPDSRPTPHSSTSTVLPPHNSYSNCNNTAPPTTGLPSTSAEVHLPRSNNPLLSRLQSHQPPPPTSILKPPPPAPPVSSQIGNSCPAQSQQTTGSTAWRIRFNIELLDNEDDNLKQFFICELKFFRKVVAALDRYLIPAQANRLLTPQEIHLIFAQVIKIITMTKRILQCVANGSNNSSWKLGRILLSTHTDHLPDITSAYTAYARSLGNSATILSEKMSIQDFAKFVLETPVPKGHLDMTSLLFAPFEHLRNLCEIAEEISHQHDNWVFLNSRLKECYADIVCETDFMEPISHISMKKNPLVSVRDLEKRIISTTSQQPLKVCEKGRRWLFGSRLYRRETDGSWSPVWAFLFTDIIVLTSHMTRDRVFFVKESPIRLDDVVTLHFNLPKKHENEFRLLFGPDTSHHSRLDRILPLRSKKSNQVVLRTANVQLKSLWKLLLQRQIISLNTKLSKSSSSNFSISEFCEKFPVVQHDSIMEEDEEKGEAEPGKLAHTGSPHPLTQRIEQHPKLTVSPAPGKLKPQASPNVQKARQASQIQTTAVKADPIKGKAISKNLNQAQQQQVKQEDSQKLTGVEDKVASDKGSITQTSSVTQTHKPYIPDGFSSLNKDLLKTKVVRTGGGDRRPSIPPSGVSTTASNTDTLGSDDRAQVSTKTQTVGVAGAVTDGNVKSKVIKPTQHDIATSTGPLPQSDNLRPNPIQPPVPKARTSLSQNANASLARTSPAPESSSSPIPSHNNNNTIDNIGRKGPGTCPCEERIGTPAIARRETKEIQQPTAYPSPKPRQLSNLRKMSKDEGTQSTSPVVNGIGTPKKSVMAEIKEEKAIAKGSVKEADSALQSPMMVRRAQALQSGSATPSSSSSLSPARLQSKGKSKDVANANDPVPASTTNDIQVSNGSLKSKPGSKIMTNAILKSRQQEIMTQTQTLHSAVSTETLRTERSSDTTASTSKTDSSTQYFSLKEESTTTSNSSPSSQHLRAGCIHKNILVHHQHHSHHCPGGCTGTSTILVQTGLLAPNSPHPPRCNSENGHHPKKPVHTDSPIISGYGSERTRRRMMVDNKLKKDYPELFGITPKDRRTFIKQLGEEDLNNSGLVAPYYYTMSPVPLPKHVMTTMSNSNNNSSIRTNNRRQGNNDSDNGSVKPSPFVIPPYNPNNSGSKQSIKGEKRDRSSLVTAPRNATSSAVAKTSSAVEKGSSKISIKQLEHGKPSSSNAIPDPSQMIMVDACSSSFTRSEIEQATNPGGDDDVDACGFVPHLTHDVFQASLELDEDGERLKAFVEKMREDMSVGGVGTEDEDDDENDDEEEEDEEDDDEEDSDDSTAGGHEEEHGQSHRSHEESSNDSGISDEMTEKSKTTLSGLLEEDERSLSLSISRRNENFSNMLDRMRSGVLAAEVTPDKFSPSAVSNSTTPVANSNTAHLIHDHVIKSPVDLVDGNNVHVVDNNNCCSPNNASKPQFVASAANHSSHVCCSSSSKAHVVDDRTCCFLEGETKASVATMVVLKVDKATETEEDDFNLLLAMNSHHHECSHSTTASHHPPQKPLRSILAERREAFFLSQQSSFSNPNHPYSTSGQHQHSIHFAEDYSTHHHHQRDGFCAPGGHSGVSGVGCFNCSSNGVVGGGGGDGSHPLIVKILDGGTLHSVVDPSSTPKKTESDSNTNAQQLLCERVQLQRLERQKRAKVERVESEDSTSSSSDLASASPAAENGTTDPSWSSSSSSLAGYGSSKEDSSIPVPSCSVAVSATAGPSPSTLCTLCTTSASSSVSAVANSACCSHCSNANHNPTCASLNNNKDSLYSGTSCSTSAQTTEEPHLSTSAHSLLQTNTDSVTVTKGNESCITNINDNSSNTLNNVASSSSSCSHRPAKNFSSTTTTNNNNYFHSERSQSLETSESTSTSYPSISPTTISKLHTDSKPTTTSTSTTTSPSLYRHSVPSTSRVVVVPSGQLTDDGGGNNNNNNNEEEPGPSSRKSRPEIVVTQESDQEDSSHSSNDNGNTRHGYSSDGEEDSIVCNGKAVDSVASDGGNSSAGEGGSSSNRSSKGGFLRVESNDSTAENYGDDDDYNDFDDDDDGDDLSHCSVATINRYGTFESLEKLESEDTVGGLPDFPRSMPRSKARFTFEDDDDDMDDLFEEDFDSDFNFRFPSQIQDNTYSVSRLGPLPPLLEEDYEDEMYDETRASGVSPSSSMGEYSGGIRAGPSCSSSGAASLRARHEISAMAVQGVSQTTSSLNMSGLQATSPMLSSSLVSRAHKLVIVKSSESEMLFFAQPEPEGKESNVSNEMSSSNTPDCSPSSVSATATATTTNTSI